MSDLEKIKKIEIAKKFISENISLFRCPLCSEKVLIKDNSLICLNNHCFDLSRKGYINFLISSIHSKYNREMFISRKLVTETGFFQPLIEKIARIILDKTKGNNSREVGIVLDAACGEGSILTDILTVVSYRSNIKIVGIGLDISLKGIKIASANNTNNINNIDHFWLVGDLARSPFNNNQFDIIVNILSPANYIEFKRILKKDGLLIKVLPNPGYLQEIRKIFYSGKEGIEYSNQKTYDLLLKNFNLYQEERVVYKRKIDKDYLIPLLKMTPLSWNINEEEISNKYLKIREITVDLKVVSAKNY
jgi:23S rRNA (guanine745-N1)-methyltransferase